MDVISQLEERVTQLLTELDLSRNAQQALQSRQLALDELTAENARLKEQLRDEQKRNAEALERVQHIIEQIKGHTQHT